MATRTISTRIALEGEQEFKRQMKAINSELKTLGTEMQYTEAKFKGQENSVEALTEKQRIYQAQIAQQQEKVKALAQAVVDATKAYGKGSVEVDRYKQQLNRARTELTKTYNAERDVADALERIQQEGDQAAEAIKNVGDGSSQASRGLGDMEVDLGKLKNAIVGGALVVGTKELAGAIMNIADSTKEYRQIMGTLQTSSEAAGYSADETTEAYSRLYGVLGDQQSTATTVANLQALELPQEQLLTLIDQTTGAWAKYGDSIPIDGLAEAINETIRAGQVTGTFADVLNWGAQEGETYGVKMKAANDANEAWNTAVSEAKSAEDFFNLALQETESQAERVDLVMQALADQGLTNMAEAWRQNNEDVVKANEAQSNWEQAMGRLGETLSPAADAIRNFGANAVNWLIDRFDELIPKVQDAWEALSGGDMSHEKVQNMAAQRGYDTGTGTEIADTAQKIRDLNAATSKTAGGDNAAYSWKAAEDAEAEVWHSLQTSVSASQQRDNAAHAQMIADRAAAEAVAQTPRGGDIVINLSNEVGGTTVARKQYRFNQAELDRRGQNMY